MAMSIQPEFSPGAPGGVCFVCKSARRQGEGVVDFYVDPEALNWVVPTSIPGMAFELAAGSLELCESCITEAGRGFGMVSADQAALLKAANENFKAAWADAVSRAEAAEAALATLRHYDDARAIAERVFGPEPK